jgi:ketosteroid isomerase-like protein
LRDLYDAFDRKDVDGLVGLLAHDVVWRIPDSLPWGGTRHGHDGVRVFVELLEEQVDCGWGDPEDFFDAGDRVIVTGLFSGTARATGRRFETEFASVWAFRDGVPTRLTLHLDTAAVLSALQG